MCVGGVGCAKSEREFDCGRGFTSPFGASARSSPNVYLREKVQLAVLCSLRFAQLAECDGVDTALVGAATTTGAFRDVEHAANGALASLFSDACICDAQRSECRRELECKLVSDELVVG